ncbi:MAG: polyphosphate polymerase domain-containing protein [Massilimicrobiota sp.]|jgi:hypothetical protein|nr:polyphosphate polymerase domain-containing protein [Massilimicrobiota sp.]
MIFEYQPVTYRHEMKHRINPLEAQILTSRFDVLFQQDKYSQKDGFYHVHSLYFDTPYDQALKEKLAGVSQREKFRIRYYNHDLSFIRLEKKIKHNGLCAKQTARLSVEQVQDILNGEVDFLLKSENPVMIDFYSQIKGKLLQPSVIVSYQRQAYVYEISRVRLTIDHHLCTYQNKKDFLNLKHGIPIDNHYILEVKYNEFLPEIVKMSVQGISQKTSSYSKFAQCRMMDW